MKLNTHFKIAIYISILIELSIQSSLLYKNYNEDNGYSMNIKSINQYSRFNRFGRAELDNSLKESIKNCGKRKRTIEINRKCFRQCQTDSDCRGSKRKCLCDGECGLSCVRTTTACIRIGEFQNGFVNYYPDNYFGAQLVYQCNPGFTLIGDKVRLCEGDGWWSGNSPVCTKETFCDPPSQIQNAIANIQITNESKFKTGTEVEYQCDIGYQTSSLMESKIVCLETGKWSDIKFKCSKINCGRPDDIENGIIKGSDYYYSSVIEYKCLPGYRIRNGDYLRECDLDAKWSGKKPTCEPIDCGEPPFVKNSIVNYNSTRYGQRALYECSSAKYYFESNDDVICLINGKWSEPLPKCVEKTCSLDRNEYSKNIYSLSSSSSIDIINHLNDNFTFSINTIVEIKCKNGYTLSIQTEQLTCILEVNENNEKIAKWSSTLPVCKKEILCQSLKSPEHGHINYNKNPKQDGYPLNTTIEVTCDKGYKLTNQPIFTCVQNLDKAEWNGFDLNNLKCELDTNLINNASSQESCKIDSSSMLISYSNQQNDLNFQTENEFLFLNASIGDYIKNEQTVLYYCKSNSMINYSAKCLNGTLLMQQNCNELVKDSKLACSSPPKISNGYNKYSSSQHGSKVFYQCFNGYELSKGSSELKCIDGEWIGSIPVCTKINCGFPGVLENGKIFYIGTLSEYTYQPYMNTVGQNKQIRYECDKDFKLVGPNGSTCINGNWKPSIKMVKCVRDERNTDINEIDKSSILIPTDLTLLYNKENENVNLNESQKKKKLKKNIKLKRLKKQENEAKKNSTQNQFRNKKSNSKAIKKLNHYHEKKVYLN